MLGSRFSQSHRHRILIKAPTDGSAPSVFYQLPLGTQASQPFPTSVCPYIRLARRRISVARRC